MLRRVSLPLVVFSAAVVCSTSDTYRWILEHKDAQGRPLKAFSEEELDSFGDQEIAAWQSLHPGYWVDAPVSKLSPQQITEMTPQQRAMFVAEVIAYATLHPRHHELESPVAAWTDEQVDAWNLLHPTHMIGASGPSESWLSGLLGQRYGDVDEEELLIAGGIFLLCSIAGAIVSTLLTDCRGKYQRGPHIGQAEALDGSRGGGSTRLRGRMALELAADDADGGSSDEEEGSTYSSSHTSAHSAAQGSAAPEHAGREGQCGDGTSAAGSLGVTEPELFGEAAARGGGSVAGSVPGSVAAWSAWMAQGTASVAGSVAGSLAPTQVPADVEEWVATADGGFVCQTGAGGAGGAASASVAALPPPPGAMEALAATLGGQPGQRPRRTKKAASAPGGVMLGGQRRDRRSVAEAIEGSGAILEDDDEESITMA